MSQCIFKLKVKYSLSTIFNSEMTHHHLANVNVLMNSNVTVHHFQLFEMCLFAVADPDDKGAQRMLPRILSY